MQTHLQFLSRFDTRFTHSKFMEAPGQKNAFKLYPLGTDNYSGNGSFTLFSDRPLVVKSPLQGNCFLVDRKRDGK